MEKITPSGVRRRKLYRGISLYNQEVNGTGRVYDVDAVKVDLLNHIFTRRGTRPMMPRFGTRIPDLIMEQLDDETVDAIEEDIRAVIDYDPRVALFDDTSLIVVVDPDANSVRVSARLRYIELDYVDELSLNIEFGN